jgi:hypothetical protein
VAARLAAVLLVALVFAAPAGARRGPTPVTGLLPPQSLKAFLLRTDEPAGHTFSRTPSFAWAPVTGAVRYEFELSTTKRFSENGIVYSTKALKTPVAAIPISLPWTTGASYSLFAHVRAVTRTGVTAWSAPYGFTMRWPTVPQPLEPSYPGLVRWTPIAGANAYMVWFVDVGKWFTTLTNVADEREYYTFHQSAAWTSTVRWRVRAVRWLYGATENGLPPVSYGPWSPIYTSYNPPLATGPLAANAAVSNATSDALTPSAHGLMPGFVFSGNQSLGGTTEELYHVYVFTDSDCLNMVYRSAVVGSPAYAPRPTGPLQLPGTAGELADARTKYLKDGEEGAVYTAEHIKVTTSEKNTGSDAAPGSGGDSSTGGDAGAGTSLPISQVVNGAKVDLWDTDWPTGRYYWTVVPVTPVVTAGASTTLLQAVAPGDTTLRVGTASGFAAGNVLKLGTPPAAEDVIVQSISGSTITLATGITGSYPAGTPVGIPDGSIEYRDAELTQDACASGRVLSFGKTSEPVVTGTTAPFVSGLSPRGRLFSANRARPTVYGTPLIAWQPALGADYYELQWSKYLDPWVPAGKKQTAGTAVTLPLSPGLWYYRVRGMNTSVPGGKPQMSWSDPASVQIAKPRFRVVKR